MNMRRYLPALLAATCLLLISLGAPNPAQACSFAAPMELEIEDGPAPEDVAPPTKPKLRLERLKRGQGPQRSSTHGQVSSTCDDIGQVVLSVEPHGEYIGYEFELVDGQLPEAYFELPSYIATLEADGQITMVWIDDAEDEQEPIDFSLVAHPVDKWGRRGPASEPLHISHPGSDGTGDAGLGCAAASGEFTPLRSLPGPLALLVSTGIFVAFGRRRKRTH